MIWSPPPAGAEFALRELRQARHKRQDSIHIFVCPRLMTHEWSSSISKVVDLLITVPVGPEYWSNEMHEPLRLGFCFPFVRVAPWQLKGCKAMVDMGRRLSSMWKDNTGTERHLLHKLCCFAWRMETMPLRQLRDVLFGRSLHPFPCVQRRGGESSELEEKSEA